jgi:starvation-inducible DNA-binding protein
MVTYCTLEEELLRWSGALNRGVNSLSESIISLNGRYKELAMTATTHMTFRRDENSVRNFTASSLLAENLQRVLVDLIELHLQGKQAHWNVIGTNFRDLHLQLDELVDFARLGSDTIAERMRALDAVPDGRSDTVAATTTLPQFPDHERNTAEVVDLITTRTYAAIDTLRKVHDAVDAEDPSTADILHAQIDGLEKLAWLIKSENRKV